MNAKELFNQAKAKSDKLPKIVRTPLLIESVMLAEVSKWLSFQDETTSCDSIVKTANAAVDLINDYIGKEIL